MLKILGLTLLDTKTIIKRISGHCQSETSSFKSPKNSVPDRNLHILKEEEIAPGHNSVHMQRLVE
jgi:hypothetical protein